MDLKNLADKLADLEKLEKSIAQTSNKVPGQQPTMDPKADVNAMQQALSVLRAAPMQPQAPTVTQSNTSQQTPSPAPTTIEPTERPNMQQKNKPGEPVGEEMVEEETARERYIRQAKERIANDPSYIYQVDSRVRDEIKASMTPQQRNIATLQRNLARAYANNDQEAIAKFTTELEKRKSATKPADTTTDKPADTTTDKPVATTTDKPAASKVDKTGPWYKGTEGDYEIKPGDTLFGIAKKTGIPMSQLQKMNDIKNPNKIVAGARLKTGIAPKPEDKPEAPRDIVTDPNSGEQVPSDSTYAQAIRSGEVTAAGPSTAPSNDFKFSPEQEKWLGSANRQDPDIISRMPGPKPPVSYFKTPELQDRARELNQGTANLNTVADKIWGGKPSQAPFQDNKSDQSGASTPKPEVAQGVKDAQAASTEEPPSPPKPEVAQGVKDAQAASTAKAPKVKSIDTLRHAADSSDQDSAQSARDEIKHRMQAGTLKENLISLNNVVEELLEK